MHPLSLSILGLSETLSVVVVLVAGFLLAPACLMAFFAVDEWRSGRREHVEPDWRYEHSHPDGPAEAGILISDFVDEATLLTVAKQVGLEPEPVRKERGQASTASRGGGMRLPSGLFGQFGKERVRDEREYFDIQRDPNSALVGVLGRLEREGELERHVGHAPVLPLDDDTLELVRGSEETTSDLRLRLIAAQKIREFRQVAARTPFLLLDGRWSVAAADGMRTLTLVALKKEILAYDHYDDPPPDQPGETPMPPGLVIQTHLPAGGASGAARLIPGQEVTAGLFATVDGFDDEAGTLTCRAIAVFARHGTRRQAIC